jgi:hypothetical protein
MATAPLVLVAAPPKNTPFFDASGRIQTPWLAWLGSITSATATLKNDIGTALQKAANLSDLASIATARANLGLGTAALHAVGDFDAAGAAAAVLASSAQKAANLSDLASATTSRTNLGLGSAATQASSAFLQPANNLSDVASSASALSNLLGGWQTWTPVITADTGMTVSAVTITTAEYVILGPLVHFNLSVSLTLGGTAALSVFVTLPTLPVNSSTAFAISPRSVSVNQNMVGRSDSVNYSLFRPSPSTNWTLGAQSFICSGAYRRI